MPREAAGSAVSSRVRQSFGEKFTSRGREDKIKHVGYFWPREANSSILRGKRENLAELDQSMCSRDFRASNSIWRRRKNYWLF